MKKKLAAALAVVAFLALVFIFTSQPKQIGGDKDEHGCLIAAGYSWCGSTGKCLRTWEEACPPSSMTLLEARQIAQQSVCVSDMSLTEDAFYNEATKTWWIDLTPDSPGCNPACVVSEDSVTAEVNWRCTGLIPE